MQVRLLDPYVYVLAEILNTCHEWAAMTLILAIKASIE